MIVVVGCLVVGTAGGFWQLRHVNRGSAPSRPPTVTKAPAVLGVLRRGVESTGGDSGVTAAPSSAAVVSGTDGSCFLEAKSCFRHEKALDDTGEGVAAGERPLLTVGIFRMVGTTGRDLDAEGAPSASSIRLRVFWTWSRDQTEGVQREFRFASLCQKLRQKAVRYWNLLVSYAKFQNRFNFDQNWSQERDTPVCENSVAQYANRSRT